ncbi:MAG: TIGR00282 family metallophosphoesterase [Acholeplasmataceae bacterium]
MKVLMIGDIYGEPGLNILASYLPKLKTQYRPHLIIANAENAANGRGITKKIYKSLMSMGIHALTMGNHVWANKELKAFIDESNIARPVNFADAPGKGYVLLNFNGQKILIMNVLGRTFMNANLESPFYAIDNLMSKIEHDVSILDIHAEATSEKVALGHYFDGKIDIIYGTHTHVQTNDHRTLPQGTFYMSDLGMTGPLNGVIGVRKDIVIDRFLNGFSSPNVVADGKKQLNGWFIDTENHISETIHLESE